MTREPRIVIIGAGLAGIATAVTLQRNGFHDFSILEKGTERRRSLALESLPRADVRRAVAARERELAQHFFARTSAEGALVQYCQAILNLNEFVYVQ
jgi:glycine/D-amino acid oxidase-like deaminating enzyme